MSLSVIAESAEPEARSLGSSQLASGLILASAVVTAVAFALLGYHALAVGQPHEDAYILYRYVHHLAAGHGIVFNIDGPRAEGATDFLWLVLLAGQSALGLDPAIAALACNTVGAAILGAVLASAVRPKEISPRPWGFPLGAALVALVPATVVCSLGSLAAWNGFSSILYSALAVLTLHVSLQSPRALLAVPFLALLLALFRPDGVVLGSCFGVVGLVAAHRTGHSRQYLRSAGIAAALGAGYFSARWAYFGLPLPLPLYVKSRLNLSDKASGYPTFVQAVFESLPGLGTNLDWLVRGRVLPLAGFVIVASALAFRDRPRHSMYRELHAIPFIALYVALSRAHQSQNVAWRFQAPITLALVYLALRSVHGLAGRGGPLRVIAPAAVGAAMLWSASLGFGEVRRMLVMSGGNYMNDFAPRFGPELQPADRVVLTEAGRLPYWSNAIFFDAVGLNTPEAAREPVTVAMVERFAPDLVFYHHAATLAPPLPAGQSARRAATANEAGQSASKAATANETSGARIVSIAPLDLQRLVLPRWQSYYDREIHSYAEFHFSGERLAPLVLTRFLAKHAHEYDVLLVDLDGDGTYYHVYGWRKDWARGTSLLKWLEEAIERPAHSSYLELIQPT